MPFPDIAPEIFSIEMFGLTLALRWYAVAYIAGLLLGWALVRRLMARPMSWPGGVAQDPPFSTFWPDINLPLYSPPAPSVALNPG